MGTSQDSADPSDATFRTRRVLAFPRERVFEAFALPELLARWWGPNGFTNTFETFEFRPGGRWKFVMHGPDGSNYPNESVFLDLNAPSRVVIHHVSLPRYVLTITLAAHEGGTAVGWVQEFESVKAAVRLKHIVQPANEQNLDRLRSVLSEAKPATETHRIPQFENAHVKVWKSVIVPNQPLPAHRHEHGRVIVALQGGTIRIAEVSGESETQVWETGRAYWLPANPPRTLHTDRNMGDRPIEVMVIEVKDDV